MAKKLGVLLDVREPLFTVELRQLEGLTGHRAIDVAYLADVLARAHTVMRKIGLDPADTTEKELYAALNAHVDDRQLFMQTDDVGLLFGRNHIVSFNNDDIAENATKLYEQRTVRHMRCEMKHALTARYVNASSDDEVLIREIVAQSGLKETDLAEYHEQKVAMKVKRRRAIAPYILCIGDSFSDVFIELPKNSVRIDTERDGVKRLSVPLGDMVSYDSAKVVYATGSAPNAAVGMARLGGHVGLMSWLGNDDAGKNSLVCLAKQKVDTTYVFLQRKSPSNTRYMLRVGMAQTILAKNELYDYRWKTPNMTPDWIYLSSMHDTSWVFHRQLLDYLKAYPTVKFAFRPGTAHIQWGTKKLAQFYKRAEIVIVNREEAEKITHQKGGTVRQLVEGLHELGPRYVVVVDKVKGAYAYDGEEIITVPHFPSLVSPIDQTGADTAFASTIVIALAQGKTMNEALFMAPINSTNVAQSVGAQAGLLSKKEIQEYIKNAPEGYQCKEYTR